MTPARTHLGEEKGRMGTMTPPSKGGCFPDRGPGRSQSFHGVIGQKGRMGTMGRMFRHLSLGKSFGHCSKTFPVCGRESSSLSSPSSLFGLQAIENKRCGWMAGAEIILPFFGVILPILPDQTGANQRMAALTVKTTKCREGRR